MTRKHPPRTHLGPTPHFLNSSHPPPTPARTLASLKSNPSEPTVTSKDSNNITVADHSEAPQKAGHAPLLPQSLAVYNKTIDANSRVNTIGVEETHLAKKMLNISTPQPKALPHAHLDQFPSLTPVKVPSTDMATLTKDTVSALLIDQDPPTGSPTKASLLKHYWGDEITPVKGVIPTPPFNLRPPSGFLVANGPEMEQGKTVTFQDIL